MKTIFSYLTGVLLLLLAGNAQSEKSAIDPSGSQQAMINVTCVPELYSLASEWADVYNSLNPGVLVRVRKSPGPDVAGTTAGTDGIGLGFSAMGSRDQASLTLVVGRNVAVPLFNQQNPFKDEILKKGVSPELLHKMIMNPDQRFWSLFASDALSQPVHFYIVEDESIKSALAELINVAGIPDGGIAFGDRSVVLKALQEDPYAIGFCNITDIVASDSRNLPGGISLMPIDRNGNGRLDYFENIYRDLNQLMRGVWIGKYPKPLYKNIYAYSRSGLANESEAAFLKWLVSSGQKYIAEAGYSDLVNLEIQSQLSKLEEAALMIPQAPDRKIRPGIILTVLLAVIATAILLGMVIRKFVSGRRTTPGNAVPAGSFHENTLIVPKGLLYDKSHTWAFMESDGMVKVGMDDFMHRIIGPITRIIMKNPGDKIKKGGLLFSVVQSGKQLNLYAPVSGTIVKQNEALAGKSPEINEAQATDGWVYMIEPSNWFRDMQLLDMSDHYQRFLKEEFSRVKDFLAGKLMPERTRYAHVVLQEGGELMNGVLSAFGPEVWEDFQSDFLDSAG